MYFIFKKLADLYGNLALTLSAHQSLQSVKEFGLWLFVGISRTGSFNNVQ
jgi:hypothetical protein